MTATRKARARWDRPPVVQAPGVEETYRRRLSAVEFDREDDGTLAVYVRGRRYTAPVPEAPMRGVRELKAGHPGWITLALDARGLDGPAVDEALGVPEPTVDEWEAGTRTPSESDLRRLATLTGYALTFFTKPGRPPEITGWSCRISTDLLLTQPGGTVADGE
jgi:hypothetical protein